MTDLAWKQTILSSGEVASFLNKNKVTLRKYEFVKLIPLGDGSRILLLSWEEV